MLFLCPKGGNKVQYSDNPRKVYGKVNIIYSDSEISMDLSTETSGNGEISYPEQVYGSYLSPTIKACTMDGNSTMGGAYQMNDCGLVTGWWSDVHCDENFIIQINDYNEKVGQKLE